MPYTQQPHRAAGMVLNLGWFYLLTVRLSCLLQQLVLLPFNFNNNNKQPWQRQVTTSALYSVGTRPLKQSLSLLILIQFDFKRAIFGFRAVKQKCGFFSMILSAKLLMSKSIADLNQPWSCYSVQKKKLRD